MDERNDKKVDMVTKVALLLAAFCAGAAVTIMVFLSNGGNI